MSDIGPTTTGDSPKIKTFSAKIWSFFKLIKTRRSSSDMDSFTNLTFVISDSQLDTLGSDVSSPFLFQRLKQRLKQLLNAVFWRENRVSPYTMPEETDGQQSATRSSAASAASTNLRCSSSDSIAGSVGSEQGTPRRSDEGPNTLPKSIQDIANHTQYTIDSYLKNIQNLRFGNSGGSLVKGAKLREICWQFLKHIITLPLGIDESEVEKSGGSTSTDGITRENVNPEEMEKIRTNYIRDTLTEMMRNCSKNNSYLVINENDKPHIKDFVEKAIRLKNSDVLVELVKVLDSDGITFFFETCTKYLTTIGSQEKETLKDALDKLLDNNDQMKLSWTGKSSGSSPNNDGRWESFKAGCIQLSKDVFVEEYRKATKDIVNCLSHIRTYKEKNVAKEDEAAESQKETGKLIPINSPGAFILLRLIKENSFEGIKDTLNMIGDESKIIRDKNHSAVEEALVFDVLYGKNPDVKPLVDYLSRFNSDSPD